MVTFESSATPFLENQPNGISSAKRHAVRER